MLIFWNINYESSVATLSLENLVKLERVAQDGIKVRASAGAASAQSKNTLEKHLEAAEDHLEKLRSQEKTGSLVICVT